MSLFKKLIARAMRGQLSKLDTLYQRHAGQECYIFGNGPSLKWMDLNQFVDRHSILCNLMMFHKEVNTLKSLYFPIIEPLWFWPFLSRPRAWKSPIQDECRKYIIQNPDTHFFINFSNYPVTRFSNALYVSRLYKPPFETKNPFRDREDAHSGTFNFQISLAIYLGFKKAYLVGHDCTHSPSRRDTHFYEKGEGIFIENKAFMDLSREFINYAKQHIELVTVTLDGISEIMDFITYKDLTGKAPRFRENIDIVDRAKLESLATWEGIHLVGKVL